jgi:uncharacterized repeat protein (TIGR03809 family)
MSDITIHLRDYQVSRWRKLAEQRLEHITELFVSGRWQRYFSETDFLEMVRQTKDAVAIWRRLEAPPIETPMPPRPLMLVAEPEDRPTTAAAPAIGTIGLLAPHVRLEKFLEEYERETIAAVAELRPAMRLPSPFEDAIGTTAVQRVRRV